MRKPRGFTLIELMVGVVITMLIGGGAIVYINNFNSQNQLDETKSQIESAMRMARDYAVTMQKPVSYNPQIENVMVRLLPHRLEIWANGDTGNATALYFSQDYYDEEVVVTPNFGNGDIYFGGYDGTLRRYNPTTTKVEVTGATDMAEVNILINKGAEISTKVLVDHMGLLVKPTPTPTISSLPYSWLWRMGINGFRFS